MNYVLLLAGWYPNQNDKHVGDFVQHHAEAVALYKKIVVLHITKSTTHKKVVVEKIQKGNLLEYIVYYPAFSLFGKFISQLYYEKLYRKYVKLIFVEHGLPEFAHVYIAWKAGLIVQYLKKNYKIPYIISDQTSAYYPNDLNFIKKQPIRFAKTRSIFLEAIGMLSISHVYYKVCNQLFGITSNYVVVENTVDTNTFYFQEKNNSIKQFIHISTMDYPKNIEGLLEGIYLLHKKRKDFELKLVGPVSEQVKKIIKEYSLESIITTTGMIPYTDVATHLRCADMLILFSRFEGLPSVLLESFCCGVPVISTNVGGIAEIINNTNGVLIDNEDVEGLVKQLELFLDNKEKYDNAQIAKDATAIYSNKAIGKKIIAAYDELLKQTGSS